MDEQNMASINESLIDSYMNSLATATHNLFIKTAQNKALMDQVALLEAKVAELTPEKKGK